ncbi:MAG: hypothetical protein WD595_05500 [Waddliaceae bacterium]
MSAIPHLAANIQSIHCALLRSDMPELVANWQGTHLYDAKSFQGRLWRIIHTLLSPFTQPGLHERHLRQALEKTEDIFKKELPELIQVAKLISIGDMDIGDVNRRRFCHAIYQLGSFLKDRPVLDEKLERLCNRSSPSLYIEEEDLLYLEEAKQFVRYENATHQKLPHMLLRRLSRGFQVDMRDLVTFVVVLNQEGGLTPSLFSSILDSLGINTQTLIIRLKEHGLKLIEQEDQEFIRWQQKLVKGDLIRWAGREFRFTGERYETYLGDERFTLFSVEGEDFQIVMGKNPFYHWIFWEALSNENNEKNHYLPTPMGPDRSCVKKLIPISHWTTLEGAIRKSLIVQIERWIVWLGYFQNDAPRDFSHEKLFFSLDGSLSYLGQSSESLRDREQTYRKMQSFVESIKDEREVSLSRMWENHAKFVNAVDVRGQFLESNSGAPSGLYSRPD